MKRLVLLFLLSFQLGSAQSLIDSLKQQLTSVQTDTDKVKTLNELSRQVRTQDLSEAYDYASQAKELSNKVGFNQGKLVAQINQGLALYFKGEWDNALKIFIATLDEAEKNSNKRMVAQALINIGVIYEVEKHYGDAISNYNKALKILIEIKDEKGTGTAYSNLGAVYYNLKNFKKALEYYEKTQTIVTKYSNKKAMAGILNNIGGVYAEMKDHRKALDYYFKSLELKQGLQDKNGIALILNNIGETYRDMGDSRGAEKFSLQSVNYCLEVGNNNLLKDAYLNLAYSYENAGDYKNAYHYHTLFSSIKDSLYNSKSAESIAELETKFKSVEKDKELLVKDLEIKEQQSKGRQQQIIMISLVAGLTLALVAIFFIFKGYSDKKKANLLIAKQKELVEVKQKAILDSIHYAKRIQTALLPSEKYIERNLTKTSKKN